MEAALAVLAVITVGAVVLAVRAQHRASRAQRIIDQLERIDPLTGLPNRDQLVVQLDQVLRDAQRTTSRVAVVALELHRFAYLNETYGHEVGDALLAAVSRVLAGQTRSDELVVRYGGPQFVVVIPETPDPAVARQRAAQLLDAIQRSYPIGPDRIRLRAHAGVVITDQQVTTVDDVLLDVHVALQAAIDEQTGEVSLFDASMRSRFSPSAAEHRLREALDRDEFWLVYLPVVELRDGKLTGVEALLRWEDRETGVTSPGYFLRSLEETGLILPVGAWVLREACRQARAWSDALPGRDFEVTINISPRQLIQSDFVDLMRTTLDESGVDPARISIELTEGTLLDLEGAWSTLRDVRKLGVKLAVDDFGTGSSSLAYLRRFRLDSLKIAREFVTPLGESREDEAIVQQLIGLAHALDMRAIAEGVETAAQAELLRELGCDAAQGYHFASPQPPDVMSGLLERGRLDATDRTDRP
jgi:diguanylate cyclase (GGDEF)-like protein